MIVLSFGYTCYVKSILQVTGFNKETNIFDWMNTFEFNKIIKSIDTKFDIFSDIIKSPLTVDLHSTSNVYFNPTYSFRLPHEPNLDTSKLTYTRRYERLLKYKNTTDEYLLVRLINTGRYGINPEDLGDNYNESCYTQIMTYLPSNSKILLLNDQKMSPESLNKIYDKFIIVDDCINPEHAFFGKYLHHKKLILDCYKSCFEYIATNFTTLDAKTIHTYIKNKHIGITSEEDT